MRSNRYSKRQLERKNTHCKTCRKPLKLQYKRAIRYCSNSCRKEGIKRIKELKFHNRQRKKYKLTKDEYSKLLSIKLCQICGTENDRMCIDHCHSSGKVRGRLCNRCNIGLGKFRDSVTLLKASINYLNKQS